MTTSALDPNALYIPSRIFRFKTGIHRAHLAAQDAVEEASTAWEETVRAVGAAFVRAQSRVAMALDPEVSRTVAAYRVAEGRTLRLGAEVLTAPVAAQGSVAPAAIELRGLDETHRQALADAWTAGALTEHAALAAFGRLSIELLALGAPTDLIARVHAAASDEARHAEEAFSFAGAFAKRALSAGAWSDLARAVRLSSRSRTERLVSLAEDALLEGCLAEGFGAAVAEAALVKRPLPAIRSHLLGTAADAATHADLGWALLAWSVQEGGEPVRDAVAFALRHLPTALPGGLDGQRLRSDLLERYGRVTQTRRHALWLSHRARVVQQASTLLDGAELQQAA